MSGKAVPGIIERPKEEKPIEKGFTNVFWTLLKPYTAGGKAIMGAATYIAIETAVGQAVRRVMGAPMNVRASIEIHAYTVPFLGSMNFGEQIPYYNLDSKKTVDFTDELTEGAKQIPAAAVGFIAHEMRVNGFKFPPLASRDFIYLCIGKALSRVVTAYIHTSLPEDVQIGLAVLNAIANRAKRLTESEREEARKDPKEPYEHPNWR